LIFKLT